MPRSKNNGHLHSGELRPIWVQYAVSFFALAAAVGARQILDPILPKAFEFITLYPAIAFAAYYGGLGPALLMLVLGALGADYFFLPPRFALGFSDFDQMIGFTFYILNSLVIAGLGSTMRSVSLEAQSKSYESEQAHLNLTRTLERITDCFCTLDRDWRYTYVNTHAEKYFGRSRESITGRVIWDVFPGLAATVLETELHRAMGQQVPVHFEGVWPVTKRWVEVSVYPSTEGLSVYFRDVTERKEAEHALRDSEARLRINLAETKRLEELLRSQKKHLQNLVKERTAELEETSAEIEAISYTIVHDLRAPLRSMQAFGTMLTEEYHDKIDQTGQDYLRRITESAVRMDRLIEGVLTYGRVAHAEKTLVEVDVDELLRSILESYPSFQRPNAEIDVRSPLPKVLGNAALLTQCLSNLLGNAVKFVHAGVTPRITIRAEKRDEMIRYWVEDNGIGVPKEAQESIFRAFQQLDRSYGGTGIGLAIVRKAVEKMGGAVGVESTLGLGSRFWFELPEAKPEPQLIGRDMATAISHHA